MKRNLLLPVAAAVMLVGIANAQQDSAAYRSAMALSAGPEKIHALQDLLRQYPETKLATRIYDALFDLQVEAGNERASLEMAHRSLGTLVPDARMNAYNKFAWSLATRSMGLDSALAYSARAVEMARKSSSRSLSGFQDTRAFVLYRLGNFKEAEELQRVAIKGHEDDPEYLSHLALYEHGNGKVHDALRTMSRALYLGADQESKARFFTWLSDTEADEQKREALKHAVVMTTVKESLDMLRGKELIAARSNAALLMADLGVDLFTAHQWAESAAKTLNRTSPVSEVVTFNLSFARVLFARGMYSQALGYLQAIEELASPYDSNYWLMLGRTLEQLNEPAKAINAYMHGLVALRDGEIRTALEAVYKKRNGSLDGLDNELDSLKKAGSEFNAGLYGNNMTPSGKVILAELFTGAECGPCASSDIAFDALIEHYPRSAVAVLEYHVHVPGPDPMTTNESWERYNWYGGQGTPTAVFEGEEIIIGGGPKVAARNRFNVYRHAIRKFESENPRVHLSMSVKENQDNISVEVQVEGTTGAAKPVLHIALVERSVDYTGANGIEHHAYVVRRMIDGAQGTVLALSQDQTTVNKQVNIAEVEKTIREYLDDPTIQPSWPGRRPFTGWRARPEKLNRANLAMVAWVQDMDTKEILQSIYRPVVPAMGLK